MMTIRKVNAIYYQGVQLRNVNTREAKPRADLEGMQAG